VRLRVVRAPDGAPVPGIPVFLRRDTAVRGPFHLLVETDERGRAEFPEVEPGTDLRLQVQPGAGPEVERGEITVVAGVTTDLGDVRLGALGVIDALVVDAARAPIEEARVVATLDPETVESLDPDPFPRAADPPTPVAAGRSDNHGRVRLEGVPPGIVAVRATKALLRGATDRVRVPAAGPDAAVATIVLRPFTGLGLFVTAEGRPVEGAPVRLGDERLDGFATRAESLGRSRRFRHSRDARTRRGRAPSGFPGGLARRKPSEGDFFTSSETVTDREGLATVSGFAAYVRADVELLVAGRGTFEAYRRHVGGLHRLAFPAVGLQTFVVVDGDGAPVVGARVGTRAAARCSAEVRALSRDDSRPRA